MAPKKRNQGKRNKIKIKSKVCTQKRAAKPWKKSKAKEKPLEELKWTKKTGQSGPKEIGSWVEPAVYQRPSTPSVEHSSAHSYYPDKDKERKSDASLESRECSCEQFKYPKNYDLAIPKRNYPSNSSLVAKYIKSGIDHVASFIVESAIRFGAEHGVVIPDKKIPNVYEITCPENKYEDKCRKIRFRIPDKKKMDWPMEGRDGEVRSRSPTPERFGYNYKKSPPSSWDSNSDSLEDILPLLEKLKEDGEALVGGDSDLDMLADEFVDDEEEDGVARKVWEKVANSRKGYKDLADPGKLQTGRGGNFGKRKPWKRIKRDSLELGRQRLKNFDSRIHY